MHLPLAQPPTGQGCAQVPLAVRTVPGGHTQVPVPLSQVAQESLQGAVRQLEPQTLALLQQVPLMQV